MKKLLLLLLLPLGAHASWQGAFIGQHNTDKDTSGHLHNQMYGKLDTSTGNLGWRAPRACRKDCGARLASLRGMIAEYESRVDLAAIPEDQRGREGFRAAIAVYNRFASTLPEEVAANLRLRLIIENERRMCR